MWSCFITNTEKELVKELIGCIGRQNFLFTHWLESGDEDRLNAANTCIDRIKEIIEELKLYD
jgi:hypothetical protein